MENYEKLGFFYLGKKNVEGESSEKNFFLYDSRDLTTHAVCVGMTGSGKTGLCISLLEEAAIDNIPSIIIDPKGDMGNLMLTFPELHKEDFLPWINPDEAKSKDLSVEEYADQQAKFWEQGLAKWGQDKSRIKAMRDNVDMTIYTPGSSSGVSVSILDSFSAPKGKLLEDRDLFNDRIQSTVSSLLDLLGIKADPIQSREHILLSNIIAHAWNSGKDLNLAEMIQAIQVPPMKQVGVFQIESFYPSADRFKLAMAFNNLLASPAFETWLNGEPLDIDQMLYTPSGKPRIAIFSIAHLSDSERMFFVTLLLNQVLSWMRSQPGTNTLRALLYMDEVFGYLPPVSEPPSKKPLMTLLKQARAFGLGVTLATQNPVDLDYKGLSNMGTWFIGRLQTERDIDRLLDGLTSVSSVTSSNRKDLLRIIASLKKRQFLVKNIHEDRSELITTRWALSYLRGPLTRDHINTLMKKKFSAEPTKNKKPVKSAEKIYSQTLQPQQIIPEIKKYFVPIETKPTQDSKIIYFPYLIAVADINIFHNTYGIAMTNKAGHRIMLSEDMSSIGWTDAESFVPDKSLLTGSSYQNAEFQPVPAQINHLSYYNSLDKQYESFIYNTYQLKLFQSTQFKITSNPEETERDFRIRLDLAAREKRDFEIDRLKRKYARRNQTLENQLLRARQLVEKESNQLQQKKMDVALSVGSSLLGAIFGGGRATSRVTSVARSASKLSKEKQDIARAEEKFTTIQSRIDELNKRLEEEAQQISENYDVMNVQLKEIIIRPKKTDIIQNYYGLLWVPYEKGKDNNVKILNAHF